jgi:CheY-like chemotaxis protein
VINITVTKQIMSQIDFIDNCSFVMNGHEAINKIKSVVTAALLNITLPGKIRPIALALLDLQMPNKNGMQVIEEIR